MKPSSGLRAPEASMSRSDSSREVSWTDFELLDVVRPVAGAVDELPAVWLDQTCPRAWHRDLAHAATSARTSPSSSSLAKTICADSSGGCSSVSIRSSGSVGSSYGSETPVNSLISPLNAFS